MCHQTVGLIARQLEDAGVPTLSMTSARDITRAAWPPRAVFLDYPLGHTSGRPGRPELNRTIMLETLAAFETIDEGGAVVDLPHRWAETDDWKDAVMRPATPGPGGEWADNRSERHPDPQYQEDADEAAATVSHAGQACLVCAGIDF